MKDKLRTRILQTFIDFIIVIFVSMIFLAIFLLLHPYQRGFYCNDSSIRYPYKPDDTIPLWAAGLYGAISAFCIIIFTELYVNRPCCIEESRFRTKRSKCNTAIVSAILIYAMGAMATMVITEIGKHTIGRLRPHFFDICKPKWNEISCYDKTKDLDGNELLLPKFVQFDPKLCNNFPEKAKEIREARLSFPSGHSSFTVYSMIFIIIFLEARVKSIRIRFLKSALQLIAFIASWHTCMSRVSDYKHHHTDVMAGAAIGFSVAVFCTTIMGKVLWIYGLGNDEHEEEDNKNNNNRNAIRNIEDAFKTTEQQVVIQTTSS